jgi:hypothetical protein
MRAMVALLSYLREAGFAPAEQPLLPPLGALLGQCRSWMVQAVAGRTALGEQPDECAQAGLPNYLQRRSPGDELAEAVWLLPGFVAYLDGQEAQTVTIEAALAWSQQSETGRVTTVG